MAHQQTMSKPGVYYEADLAQSNLDMLASVALVDALDKESKYSRKCKHDNDDLENLAPLHNLNIYSSDAIKAKYEHLPLTKRYMQILKEPNADINAEGQRMVNIGSRGTRIYESDYESVEWKDSSVATRALLKAVFGREVLATHTLTGKPSHAFLNQNKPNKPKLDPLKVDDIVDTIVAKCPVGKSLVRTWITRKCADENKMLKQRNSSRKNRKLRTTNSENLPNCN